MTYFISILVGYLLGNIQSAFLLGKLNRRIDIRETGTKNPGTSNAVLVLGWRFGVLTFILDALKASCSVWVINILYPGVVEIGILAGSMAVVGHIYPVVIKFRGGKGVASVIGLMIAVDPIIALVLFGLMVAISIITNQLVWGDISGLVMFPIAALLLNYSDQSVMIIALTSLLSMFRLRDNLVRTIQGTERTLSSVLIKKKK
jgi:glycerol-3-phosphate acyltransferase PlsY